MTPEQHIDKHIEKEENRKKEKREQRERWEHETLNYHKRQLIWGFIRKTIFWVFIFTVTFYLWNFFDLEGIFFAVIFGFVFFITYVVVNFLKTAFSG